MSGTLRKPMTLAEFLVWEQRQEFCFEFDGSAPVAMRDGSAAHQRIGDNTRVALRNHLRGTPVVVVGPTVKIEVSGRIRYPDAVVLPLTATPDPGTRREPIAVFEVLSPGTARTDHIEKLREYAAAASIRHYVILEQGSIGAMVFTRKDAHIIAEALTDGDTLRLADIGVELALADLYDGVDFPQGPDEPATPG